MGATLRPDTRDVNSDNKNINYLILKTLMNIELFQ